MALTDPEPNLEFATILLNMRLLAHLCRLLCLSMLGTMASELESAEIGSEAGFLTLEDANIRCDEAIQANAVRVVDVEGEEFHEGDLPNRIEHEVGPYNLVSNIAILVPRFYKDAKKRRQYLVRDVRSEIAKTGCDLLIILGTEFVDKQWEDPRAPTSRKRWVTIGYALVLIGARHS